MNYFKKLWNYVFDDVDTEPIKIDNSDNSLMKEVIVSVNEFFAKNYRISSKIKNVSAAVRSDDAIYVTIGSTNIKSVVGFKGSIVKKLAGQLSNKYNRKFYVNVELHMKAVDMISTPGFKG